MMIERVLAALNSPQRGEDLTALCASLVAENDALRLENARLRTENRHLRRRLKDRDLAIVRRAEADSLLIGALHFGQLSTSRSSCLAYGVSRRRWAWAMGLLAIARVRHRDGHWRECDMQTYEEQLRGAVAIVERKGVGALQAEMPKNGYSGRHVTRPRIPSHGHAQGHADW